MKLAIDIIVTIIILFWPGLMMISPMVFDAPGSEYNKSNLAYFLVIVFYPLVVFIIYKIAGANYFQMSVTVPLLIALFITIGGFILFDGPQFIADYLHGKGVRENSTLQSDVAKKLNESIQDSGADTDKQAPGVSSAVSTKSKPSGEKY